MPTPAEVQAVIDRMRSNASEYVAKHFDLYEIPKNGSLGDGSKNSQKNRAPQSDPSEQDKRSRTKRREACISTDKKGSDALTLYLRTVSELKELSIYRLSKDLEIPRGTLWHYWKSDRVWRIDDAKKLLDFDFSTVTKVIPPIIVDPSMYNVRRNVSPRKRSPRLTIEASPYLVQLFRMERDRRNISTDALLASLLGTQERETCFFALRQNTNW